MAACPPVDSCLHGVFPKHPVPSVCLQAAALSSSLLQPSAALLAAQQYVAAAANTQAANAASAAAAAAAPGTLLGMLTPTHSNRGGTRAGVTHIATNAQSPYAAGRASASANLAPGGGVPGPVPGSTTPPVLPRTNATGGSALRHASPAPASSAHAAYGGSHAATLIVSILCCPCSLPTLLADNVLGSCQGCCQGCCQGAWLLSRLLCFACAVWMDQAPVCC